MALAQIQHLMARLYTEAELRQRFFENTSRLGQAFGLDPEEVKLLGQVAPQQVGSFADSLHRKRLSAVAKLLPLSQSVLRKRFGALFQRYVETQVPQGIQRHHRDAIAFCTFAEQVSGAEGIEPWVVELMRYEATWVRAANPTCRWLVRLFRYRMDELVQNRMREDESPMSSESRCPTIAFWFRSRRRRLRHIVLPLPYWPARGCNESTGGTESYVS